MIQCGGLNSPDRVSAKVVPRIEQAVLTLGYVPNAVGRALASQQSNIVGALIPSLGNAMFANGLQAFQETLAQEDLAVIFATTAYNLDEEARQVRNLLSQGASSLLLIGKARHPDTQEILAQRRIPYVLAWCYGEDEDHTYIGFDNAAAAHMAAEKALGFGHRQVGLICGLGAENDRAEDRKVGFQKAVNAAPKARLTASLEVDYKLEAGRVAFQQLMTQAPETTAILCGNDVLAAGAMMGARDQGLRVPEDVSIVGFDDIGLARVLTPALTTVRIPQHQMGTLAAAALIQKRKDPSAGTSIALNTEFILRGSLGAPRT